MSETKHRAKVWILVLVLSLGLLISGFQLAGRRGLFAALFFSLIIFLLLFFCANGNMLRAMGAKLWRGQDPWGLQDLLEKYSEQLKIETPTLYVLNHPSPLAFCLGGNLKRGAVGVSLGLMAKFTPQEIEAIIAHQVCHIKRLDHFGYVVVQVFANMLMGLARLLDHFWPARWFKLHPIDKPFQKLLSPVAWFFLRLLVNDKLFFENDDMTLSLIKNRNTLANALWKLEGFNTTQPITPPYCTQHYFMVNPGHLGAKNWFLLAHPKIEIRIKRLLGYFPI